jgi:hypothetical protein
MTYHSDPTRWTQSPGDAPELLRGGLEAAGREGPSDLQMRALALKLAAVGTGAALAAGAAGAKASTTAAGAGLAATGGSMLTKIAVSVALIGAAATGGTLLLRKSEPSTVRAPVVVPHAVAEREPVQPEATTQLAAPPSAPKLEQAAQVLPPAEAPVVAAATLEQASVESTRAEAGRSADKAERRERRHARAEAAEKQASVVGEPAVAPSSSDFVQVKGERKQGSEIDLLSKARASLAARPREAYRLTEEHKALYPQGMFAQERDALAVEALQRAGDLKHARELAEVFLKRYPSSPAAHRFRETMNLP